MEIIFSQLYDYIPQIIVTVIALLLLQLSKYVVKKFIVKYGYLLQKSEKLVIQVRKVISVILNITFLFVLAIIWGYNLKIF